jgi:uncharacterized caspase-like protein
VRARPLLTLPFVAALASPALAEKRVALVVGNSAYQNVIPLDNPANDATLLAQALKELGLQPAGQQCVAQPRQTRARRRRAFGGQVQGSGTRLNIIILDACRNNPFGGRSLHAAGGCTAQIRAPDGYADLLCDAAGQSRAGRRPQPLRTGAGHDHEKAGARPVPDF